MKTIPANTPFQVASNKIAVQVSGYPTNLYYTVDQNAGWSSWSEMIEDQNVVINNIPRGLFLRFDVDVIITD